MWLGAHRLRQHLGPGEARLLHPGPEAWPMRPCGGGALPSRGRVRVWASLDSRSSPPGYPGPQPCACVGSSPVFEHRPGRCCFGRGDPGGPLEAFPARYPLGLSRPGPAQPTGLTHCRRDQAQLPEVRGPGEVGVLVALAISQAVPAVGLGAGYPGTTLALGASRQCGALTPTTASCGFLGPSYLLPGALAESHLPWPALNCLLGHLSCRFVLQKLRPRAVRGRPECAQGLHWGCVLLFEW